MTEEQPLVTVGIPTYNRPEGLKRTLEQITAQTHRNLEILISDNCSPDPKVGEVAKEFAGKDSRVKYIRQDSNIEAMPNFQYVLKHASGTFFMWASDDDEWDPRFIETCLKNIGEAGLVMQRNFKTVHRYSSEVETYEGPSLSMEQSTFQNIINFHKNTMPSLIYGLFRKSAIEVYLDDKNMDILDVYVLTRHILHHGVNTFEEQLYTAGIDAEGYEFKPIKPAKNRLFRYTPLLRRTTKEIFKCKNLSFSQKLTLSKIFFLKILGNFTNYEKEARPNQVKVVHFIHKTLIYINNFLCKITGSTNYYINK